MKVEAEINKENNSLLDNFVFMDKALAVLDVGMKTEKNVVLYGPGGHGKSELSLEFFYAQGIRPYIITMGTGMTTDRLFGGFNIPMLEKEGKIEYLVENSFMNHEFVIFEEMMDAPDFILEQLKDILSSGEFRNGTQIYPIKTKYIVACTNRTRDEFTKNPSLKALMERFPLELNVVWDNYNETTYTTLLKKRFGEVDPIIPFLLQEYVKNGIVISPRIALDCYEIYENCGPDSLIYIAEFAKKPNIINEAVKKFEVTIKFKQMGAEVQDIMEAMTKNSNRTVEEKQHFIDNHELLMKKYSEIRAMSVGDDMAQVHAGMVKKMAEFIATSNGRFTRAQEGVSKATANGVNVADVLSAVLDDKTIDELVDLGGREEHEDRPF